jgi:hypothetical protein
MVCELEAKLLVDLGLVVWGGVAEGGGDVG